jgi:Ran GTPase-activating protein (RanGAP) involved in mRNA processing and transport
MKIDRWLVKDDLEYDIMYFSPIHVGDERNTHFLYFKTETYSRNWPKPMVDAMMSQIDELRHVELGMYDFNDDFKHRHRERIMFHLKMALAYLDSREARLAMKLSEMCLPGTQSSELWIQADPDIEMDMLRVTGLSVLAVAARRVKFFQKAVDALTQAKEICFKDGEENRIHPLMTAITLLNLSAVLTDCDHDEEALRWGLEALSMMYSIFPKSELPEIVQAYYLALACHNAALLSVKLERWDDATELVDEGIEFTKKLEGKVEHDDGLRDKLISIGAQAKHVPEAFYKEAINTAQGIGPECRSWDLSFWPFDMNTVELEISVLKNTTHLAELVIDAPKVHSGTDEALARLVLAALGCMSLESLRVQKLEFDPRRVWHRVKKPTFLETSWYASAMNFNVNNDAANNAPEASDYKGLLSTLTNDVAKKLVLYLLVFGNESPAVDLSDNVFNSDCMSALVDALKNPDLPRWVRQVQTLKLHGCSIDAATAETLAKVWITKGDKGDVVVAQAEARLGDDGAEDDICASDLVRDNGDTPKGNQHGTPPPEDAGPIGVVSLDVSQNEMGDRGFQALIQGVAQFEPFQVLSAWSIGIGPGSCASLYQLETTRLSFLDISNNLIGAEGCNAACAGALRQRYLQELRLNSCGITADAVDMLSKVVQEHSELRSIRLDHNTLGSEGAIAFCNAASDSNTLRLIHLGYNEIESAGACEAIGSLMSYLDTLQELKLSGNKLDPAGAPQVGKSIEFSSLQVMELEDMGFTEVGIEDFLDHGVAETQELQSMMLSQNPVGDEGLATISECLSIGLAELHLSKCELTPACEQTLRSLLSLSPNLRTLDLSHNAIGPDGLVNSVSWIVYQNVSDKTSLRSLELANCQLGDDGFLLLASIMGTLDYLGLRQNGITSKGMKGVMNSQKMIQLSCLDMADNDVAEDGVHALTERFGKEHKRSLWNPKKLTSSIDELILSNNPKIPQALAISTQIYLSVHNPLLHIRW